MSKIIKYCVPRTCILVLFIIAIGNANAYDVHSVADDEIVIVRSKKALGAFKLFNQQMNPSEQAEYKWVIYLKDKQQDNLFLNNTGIGITGDTSKKIVFISYVKLNPIKLGMFKLYWSGHKKGHGWVYFNKFSKIPPNNYCILKNETLDNVLEASKKCFKTN